MRRPHIISASAPWQGMLWSLALLGLFLFPCDYRAGAADAHAHSLIQLWSEAAGGSIMHHYLHASELQGDPSSWFDPAVAVDGATSRADGAQPDVGDQEDSAPATSGVHLALAGILALPALTAGAAPRPAPGRTLHGRSLRVPLPPPRWTLVAA